MRLIDADALLQHQNEADKMGAMLVVGKGFILDAPTIVPQPDPITGLVPCGCGGRPYIEQDDDYYMGGWRVDCPECEIWVPCFRDKDTLVKTWNTAMGWKGGAE